MRAPYPNWRHRLRQLRRRQLAAFAAVCVALAFSGAAVAGDLPVLSEPPQKQDPQPKRPPQAKSSSEQAVASLTALLDRIDEVNKHAVASAKRKKKRAKSVELVYSMSVDQGSTYRAALTVPGDLDDVENFDGIASKIIKRDLATGAESVLYKSRNALAVGVFARSGHIVAQIFRVSPRSKRSIDLQSSILTARNNETTMRIAQSRSARISTRNESLCGAMHVVAAMSMQGEAVILEYDSNCRTRVEKTSVAGLKADGATRQLLAPGKADLDSGLILSGDLLTMTDEFDGILETRNVTTGETRRLWSGAHDARDIAADGSFAVATEVADDEESFFPPDADVEANPGVGTGTGTAVAAAKARPKRKRNPANIVVFPQGNPDAPKLNTFPRHNIETLKFCGSRLYAIRAKGGRYPDDEFLFDEGIFGFNFGAAGNFEILLLTADGVPEKSLLWTKKIAPADLTCNGDRLVIGTNTLRKTGVIEVGP